MKSMWDPGRRQELRQRLAGLDPGRPARWGRLSAPQAVVHLADSLRMAMGELPVAPRRMPIRHPPLKQLIVYWLPFPRNAPTAPELLARAPGEWRAEVESLLSLMERFAARRPEGPWPEHPAFGRLSGRAWGVLAYRHTDHHLRQFGA
jgi:hypothetical protein